MVVTVVGIGADGWPGLSPAARQEVCAADLVLGGRRQLDLLPAGIAAEQRPWPSPLRPGLPALVEEVAGRRVVALASGDPLVSGIGTTLIEVLGADRVRVLPAVSSVALARAAVGWSAESTSWVSLVGRDDHRLLRQAIPGARLLVLVGDGTAASRVAALLTSVGLAESRMVALSNLGGTDESRRESTAAQWSGDTPDLTILAVECRGSGGSALSAGLPDRAYEHDGQLTKRDLRTSALSRLAPRPGEHLWDVGAGAGSVGIEWLRTDPRLSAVAIERDAERAERIARNAARLGVPELRVVAAAAPGAFDGLAAPDAVFVGGGATIDGVIDGCWAALRPGGRLVVHGVTLETEALLASWRGREGGELTRITVEHAEPIGAFTGWRPTRTVTQWAVVKP